jgi:hypothetical protein
LPIDTTTVRPYSAQEDPGNPTPPKPSWLKAVAAALGTAAAVLIAIQEGAVFPPDSTGGKVLTIAIKSLAAIGPMLMLIWGETRERQTSMDRAAEVTIAKVEAKAEVAKSEAATQAGTLSP